MFVHPNEIAASVRVGLASAPSVHEVKMFGGIGFMLNGNMLVAVSKRGLLARIGKDAEAEALLRPGARAMEMRGRVMPGYVFVEPKALLPTPASRIGSGSRVPLSQRFRPKTNRPQRKEGRDETLRFGNPRLRRSDVRTRVRLAPGAL